MILQLCFVCQQIENHTVVHFLDAVVAVVDLMVEMEHKITMMSRDAKGI